MRAAAFSLEVMLFMIQDIITMVQDFITNFADKFYKTFIVDDRWKYLTNGLKNTIVITLFAVMLGIVLLKETSVAGYIAVQDLTKGGDTIRSATYEPFMPLIAVAIIYLVIVMVLTHFVTKLERRLAANDKR